MPSESSGNQFNSDCPQSTANLYVSGLPFHWTLVELNHLFAQFGPIKCSVVFTDKSTGASKGSGMVRLADLQSAELAMQSLNSGVFLEGSSKPLSVKLAEAQAPTERKSSAPSSVASASMDSLVSNMSSASSGSGTGTAVPWGSIGFETCPSLSPGYTSGAGVGSAMRQPPMVSNPNPSSLAAYRYQPYLRPPAVAATSALTRPPSPGLSSRPVPSSSASSSINGSNGSVDPTTNLYIAGLPSSWTANELNQLFGQFGAIKCSVLLTDKTTGLSKEAALVRMADLPSAQLAIQSLTGTTLNGASRPLTVKFAETQKGGPAQTASLALPLDRSRSNSPAPFLPLCTTSALVPTASTSGGEKSGSNRVIPTPSTQPTANLYVSGIPQTWTIREVEHVFLQFGRIKCSVLLTDRATGLSKGAAMVRMADVDAAQTAVRDLNGVTLEGAVRPLAVRFADTQDGRAPTATSSSTSVSHLSNQGPATCSGPVLPNNSLTSWTSPCIPGNPPPAPSTLRLPSGSQPPPPPPPSLPYGVASIPSPVAPPSPPLPLGEPPSGCLVVVSNLDPSVTELKLYELFGQFGAIKSVKLHADPISGRPQGIVHFHQSSDASRATSAMNGFVAMGTARGVQAAQL